MIKVVSICSALDRKRKWKGKIIAELSSFPLAVCDSGSCSHFETGHKGFWSHFFLFFFQSKQKKLSIPKRIWNFSLTNRASIFFAFFSFIFYAFTSRISMNHMLCLFGFLAPSSHVIGKCLTFMELGMLLHPPFPFYLFSYRDELFPFLYGFIFVFW